MVLSIVLSGLAIGCVYALIGIAYNVMFSASRVFSFTAGTLGWQAAFWVRCSS
jgi:branched-chain amino acid transport system permease protein